MRKRVRRWGSLGMSLALTAATVLTFTPADGVSAAAAEDGMQEIALDNGNFENGDTTNWVMTGFSVVTSNEWASDSSNHFLDLWQSDDEAAASASYSVKLTAGTYQFGFDISGDTVDSGLGYTVAAGSTVLVKGAETYTAAGWDKWTTYTTETFTLTEDTEVTFTLSGTLPAGYWGSLDNLTLTGTGAIAETTAEMSGISLDNGNFENGDTTNWVMTGFSVVTSNEWASDSSNHFLDLWQSDDEAAASASYSVKLTAGTYQFGFDISGDTVDSGLGYTVAAGSTVLVKGTETYTAAGWDKWTTYTTETFTLTEDTEVTFTLSGTLPAGYWGSLDNLTLTGTGSLSDAVDPVQDAPIDVERVTDLSDDFIMGMDISSIVSEFASGVTYQDYDGNTIDNITDFCVFLKSCGITHVRVRVWNDPFDADGNGYGGGNNDVAAAVKIAEGCAAAGLKMLVDFHYSDFWADPSKQTAPKAWSDYTLEQKETAVYEYTLESLKTIAETGAEIAMVQVGNETTGGICGVYNTADMCKIFSAGSKAVREFSEDTKVVVHVTNPEKSRMTTWAKNLDTYGVDYDVLATSYYPYWHGTLENLQSEMQKVQSTYGKDVMVAETSYAYTLNDSDGHDNTVRVGNNDTATDEPFTVQGQANSVRNVIAAVSAAGGLGVFYWEPAWITVGDTTGLEGDEYDAQVNANKVLWEQNGSGWAASYAGEYDAADAGVWYGGSAVDNEAMFAADGSPLASLHVWEYVKTGAVSNNISVEDIAASEESIALGGTYTLPTTVSVTYNKGTVDETVTWNEEDVAAIDTETAGSYVVNGTVTLSMEVNTGDYAGQTEAPAVYTLTVKPANLIGDDWSFENGSANFSGLSSTGKGIDGETPYDGSYCLHWYLPTGAVAEVLYLGEDQNGITLEPGNYTFECAAQGMSGDLVTLGVLDHESGAVIEEGEAVSLTGWKNWATPAVSFEVRETTTIDLELLIDMQDGGWGTIDCMYLYRTGAITTAAIVDCPEELELKKGESITLSPSFVITNPKDGRIYAGIYSTADDGVADVDDGVVTAVEAGNTEITYAVYEMVAARGINEPVLLASSSIKVTVSEKETTEETTEEEATEEGSTGEEAATEEASTDETSGSEEVSTEEQTSQTESTGSSDNESANTGDGMVRTWSVLLGMLCAASWIFCIGQEYDRRRRKTAEIRR